MGLLMISWFFNFVVIKKPDAIRRDEEKRGKVSGRARAWRSEGGGEGGREWGQASGR